MSDFAELRDLASKLTRDIENGVIPAAQLPSALHQPPASGAFLDDVENRLGRGLTATEKDLLTFVFNRNSGATPDEAAERLAWIANGPNAFYWGPWLPYQDP